MDNFDKPAAPYTRLQEDVSQGQSNSSNPFLSYTYQKPYTGAGPEAGAAKPAQQVEYIQQTQQTQQTQQIPQIQPPQAGQGSQITMMIGDSPQQVLIPPGFALLPGPNGQLMMQPYPAVPSAIAPVLVPIQQTRQLKISDLDEGWFVAYKIWLIVMMFSCCGASVFMLLNGIIGNFPLLAALVVPVIFLFYCLFTEYQALTKKNLRKARLAFILLSILQGLLLIAYIINVSVADKRIVGMISTIFWSSFSFFDITVYWGAFQVKKILEGHSRVHQGILMA